MDIQDIILKEIPPRTVIYLRCNGSWRQLPGTLEKLVEYVAKTKMVATGSASGIYYNTPNEVSVQDLEWEVFYPILTSKLESTDNKTGVGIRNLPEVKVASILHEGSYRKAGPSYERIEKWIKQQGYKIAGPSEEIYFNVSGISNDEQMLEIRIPVICA
ncbi:GyrI-like domain-containing protein [Chloroflexota bacterium]